MLGLGLDPLTLARGTGLGTAAFPPLLIAPPAIAGSGAIGSVLTGAAGTWFPRSGQSFVWAWQSNGTDLTGATGTGLTVAPYTVVPADNGASIRLRVTAITPAGEATAFSAPVVAGYTVPTVAPVAWTVPLRLGEALAPLSLAGAFAGLDLVFSVGGGGAPLPAGLALSADGVLSGTPTGAAGTAVVRVRATNPAGFATLDLTLIARAALFRADHVAQAYTLGGAGTSFAGLHGFSRAGTALRLGPTGVYETIAADLPRFDHDAAGVPLGLLVEGAETNRLTGSESLTTGWTTSAVTASAAGLSVRGRWAGRVLTSTGNASGRLIQTLTVTAGEALALKVWCLPGTSGRLRVQVRTASDGKVSRVRGAFGALAVTETELGPIEGLLETVAPDGVRDVGLVFRAGVAGAVEIGIGHDSAVSGQTLTLLAVQTALGSPVPTVSAPATRAADLIGLAGIAPGLVDLALSLDDGSTEVLGAWPAAIGAWPPLRRPRLTRMTGHPAGHIPLTLADSFPLLLESGQALTLETPA